MKNSIKTLLLASLLITFGCKQGEETTSESTSETTEVPSGGQENVVDATSNPNIVQVASGSKDHTTLVAAVKATDLVETLQSAGPFTVFAPTNAAFAKLPAGTVETLLKPENLKLLQTILTYHVVAGKMNAKDIDAAIKKGNGKATLKTVSGGTLTAWMKGKDLYITDENGNSAKVTIADVNQKNGVIHVVDTVVTPKS